MGNGSCKNATPTALKGYRREITFQEISVEDRKNEIGNGNIVNDLKQRDGAKVINVTKHTQEENTKVQQGEQLSTNKQEVTETKEHYEQIEDQDKGNAETDNKIGKQEFTEDNLSKKEIDSATETIATERSITEEDSGFIRTSYGVSTSAWPIRSYGKFTIPLNVNAHHGGCTALLFNSDLYGKGSNVELMAVSCGFDCNHMQVKSIAVLNNGHFGSKLYHKCDEEGTYVIDCLFGTNHYMYLSNESMYGNLRNGVFVEILENSTEVVFPLNVNGSRKETGIGISLILASGTDGQTQINGLYIVRLGSDDNTFATKLIAGEDKFKFSVTDEGMLRAEGPAGCRFSLFHNRDNLIPPTDHTYVCQTQALDGGETTELSVKIDGHAAFVVLCSNSNGTEDNTASSVYHVTVADGKVTSAKEICGMHGPEYDKSDLWKFEVSSANILSSTGPSGPCKYGVLSNIRSSHDELNNSIKQTQCLATGEDTKTVGQIDTKTMDDVKGCINKPSDVCIMLNHKIVASIPVKDLKQDGNSYLFNHKWKPDELGVGYHLIRVFAVRKNLKSGDDVFVELRGSPFSLTRQKPGVIYALNCAGPAYQDMNDIVYASEHRLFANFDPKIERGHRCKAVGGVKKLAKLPASMLKSHDGFMYAVARSAFNENEQDTRFVYRVDDFPNGKYKLRLHLIGIIKDMKVNGRPVNTTIQEQLDKIKKAGDLVGPSCYCVDIDVEIKENYLEIYDRTNSVYTHGDYLCAFAVLDNTYKDKVMTEKEKEEMQKEKVSLADKVLPITTQTTKKVMQIVGWSPNLLLNASGENLDMKYWNTHGNFKIGEYAGAVTEKVIITSHMWCEKYQEVNLLDHFSETYLDTAPDIQVSEMYREGHCDGGFYKLTVQLMSADGNVIDEYKTGEIGSIKEGGKWHEALHVFSDFGPGVRIVAFSSAGKDDKYWAGHFGVMMAAAQVRVRNESKNAEGDSYTDIQKEVEPSKKRTELEKIVTKILTDNKELTEAFVEADNTPTDDTFEKQTAIVPKPVIIGQRRQKIKKREIRVFVSSTFRDFSAEREHIIKKAFREVNRLCQDRGVFFTYVDLRWGITSEQTNGGKTISICLQEIDKCRPYFLCLMGERYGWSQRRDKEDEILNKTFDNAVETAPNLQWVEKYRYDSSITELEVMHGVLNHTDGPLDKCRFYMREPPSKEDYTEAEYKRLISESEWHQQRQLDLKARVKEIKGLNIKTFKTAPQVSEFIKQDLTAIIDEEFPFGTELTKLEQQRESHQAFASARCRVYIGRQDYFTKINENREKQSSLPFVILGESGSGKSALVANWTKQVEDAEPDTFLFKHFIGSSAESADYIKMLRRLVEEIKDYFKFDLEIPSTDSILIRDIDKWLRMAGAVTKVVIVFDALNQLDDGTGEEGSEHDLQWIPKEIPHNVFLLVSTLPGRAMNACLQAEWPSMNVEPLQDSQKMQIITDYLEGIYSKTLTSEQKEMIVGVKQTSNPLYLKSLLDEVRMYGSFRTLTDKILEYLSAETPQDLFAKILERLEQDYEEGENARVDLVRDSTSALWCSNRGMSESELVEYLNVPGAIWSPFYLSLYENLVNRNGLLNFFHDHLRRAVEKKYLSTDELKKKCYLKLADFYDNKEISNRTVEELPFLLARAGEMDRLKKTVTNLDVFQRLSDNEDGLFELIKAWNTLGGFALSDQAYMTELSKVPKEEILKNSDYYCKLYGKMGKFFLNLGLMEAAKFVYKTLIKQLELHYGESHGTIVYNAFGHDWKYRCKHPDVIKALHDLGTVYSQLGEVGQAIMVDDDAINRQNRVTTPSEMLRLCEGFLGLSAVYVLKDDMTEAKKLVTRALELATFVLGKKHHYVAAILTKLGQISYKQGRVDEALTYYMQDMKLTRSEVGVNHPRTAIVLNEIGLVYDDKNDKLAQSIYEAALSIILETYGNEFLGTGTIRYNLGASYFGTNLFLKAKYQFTESYRIHMMFLGEDHPDTKSVKEALDTVTAFTR